VPVCSLLAIPSRPPQPDWSRACQLVLETEIGFGSPRRDTKGRDHNVAEMVECAIEGKQVTRHPERRSIANKRDPTMVGLVYGGLDLAVVGRSWGRPKFGVGDGVRNLTDRRCLDRNRFGLGEPGTRSGGGVSWKRTRAHWMDFVPQTNT
jgi:hypothetical protein